IREPSFLPHTGPIMPARCTRLCLSIIGLLAALCLTLRADDPPAEVKVGVQPDGRIVVPTNQVLDPAGAQVTFPGRPVDLALADDGRTLVVKNLRDLVFIDTATGKLTQTLPTAGVGSARPGFGVVGVVAAGDRVYSGDVGSLVHVAEKKDGKWQWQERRIEL